MQTNIPLISDVYRSTELYDIFNGLDSEIEFALVPNQQTVRSPFTDPIVLAALIGASATTLSALIGALGVIWST